MTLTDCNDFLDSSVEALTNKQTAGEPISLPYDEIDPRLKLLSYSSRLTLNACPRKFQLYRLSSTQIQLDEQREVEQEVTFSYGHAVGAGVAAVFEGKAESQIYLDMLLQWDADLLAADLKRKKSFWEAIFAIQRLTLLREEGYLSNYELVYHQGKPAIELSFRVILADGFEYRGFIDIVLRHKETKEVLVLECKTTSLNPDPIQYKNSAQAIGYSVVLDKLFPELSSYSVLYLVYHTKSREYSEFVFEKSLLQRALWLQELLIDVKKIQLYHDFGSFPMHGESCNDFFQQCEYYGLCTLSLDRLTKPLTQETLDSIENDAKKYTFVFDFFDLVTQQISKGEE